MRCFYFFFVFLVLGRVCDALPFLCDAQQINPFAALILLRGERRSKQTEKINQIESY